MFSGWENPNLLFFLSAGHLGTTSSSEFLISEHEFEHSKFTAWDASGKYLKVWEFFLLVFCRFTLFHPPQTVLWEPLPISQFFFFLSWVVL